MTGEDYTRHDDIKHGVHVGLSEAETASVMDIQREEECKKLFLGGLRYTETEESVASHFERYGVVEGVQIPKDKTTGKPRGFGFVTFLENGVASRLAKENSHTFNGRHLDIKLAFPRKQQYPFATEEATMSSNKTLMESFYGTGTTSGLGVGDGSGNMLGREFSKLTISSSQQLTETENEENDMKEEKVLSNRIFVGGLPDGVTNSSLKDYFSQFGTVIDSFVLLNPITKRPRGFGFVTFKEREVVPAVLAHEHHEIMGKRVETRLATQRSNKGEKLFPKPRMLTQMRYQGVPQDFSQFSGYNKLQGLIYPGSAHQSPQASAYYQNQNTPGDSLNAISYGSPGQNTLGSGGKTQSFYNPQQQQNSYGNIHSVAPTTSIPYYSFSAASYFGQVQPFGGHNSGQQQPVHLQQQNQPQQQYMLHAAGKLLHTELEPQLHLGHTAEDTFNS